tara:strand:- start:1363 stop:1767 length:405 start_codon:yes stop_codon:yes gene_type:complete
MMHKHARKQPRFHPGLEWEGRTLSNDFIDINRIALDDSFSGKNAAPLSKRRNGIGYTDGNTPGLFGLGSGFKEVANDPRSAYFLGGLIAVGAYTALDYITYKPNQSQLRRMINRTPSSLIVGAVAFSLFAPISA